MIHWRSMRLTALSLAVALCFPAPRLHAQEKVIGEDRGFRTHNPDEHVATGDGHEYPKEEPDEWGRRETWEIVLGVTFFVAVIAGGVAFRAARERRS